MTVEVYTPRWRRLLNSMFLGRGGAGGSALTVLDDIMPVVSVTDPSQTEYHQQRGEIPWGYAVVMQGTPGNFAQFGIMALAGYMVVVERIKIGNPAAVLGVNVALDTSTVPTAPALAKPMDSRVTGCGTLAVCPGVSIVAAQIAALTAVGYVVANDVAPIGQASQDILPTGCDVILSGNVRCLVEHTTVNVASLLTISGYVRQVEPQELQQGY